MLGAGGGDRHAAVLRPEQPEGHEIRVVRSPRAQLRPVETVVADDRLRHGQHGVVHRDVEKLADSRLLRVGDRRHQAEGHQRAREDVADTGPGGDAICPFRAGDVHMPAHALRDDVVRRAVDVGARAGAPVSEAADAGVDDLRVARADGLVADAQAVHHTVAHVLDDGVSPLAQGQQNVPVRRFLQVQHDAPLVAVDAREVPAEVHAGRLFRAGRRRVGHPGRRVAAGVPLRRLDLDDIRPEIGQQRRAVWAGKIHRAVDDRQVAQRTGALTHGRCAPHG